MSGSLGSLLVENILWDLKHVVEEGLCFVKLSLVGVLIAKLPSDVNGARKGTLVVRLDGVLDLEPEVRVVEGVGNLSRTNPRVVIIIIWLHLVRPSKAEVLEHTLLDTSLLVWGVVVLVGGVCLELLSAIKDLHLAHGVGVESLLLVHDLTLSGFLLLFTLAILILELLIDEEVFVTMNVVYVALDDELSFVEAYHVVGVGTLCFCLLLDTVNLEFLGLLAYFAEVVAWVLVLRLHFFVIGAAEVVPLRRSPLAWLFLGRTPMTLLFLRWSLVATLGSPHISDWVR